MNTKLNPIYSKISGRIFLDICSRGSFFLLNILFARFLGPAELGKYGYALSLALMFSIFTDGGLHLQLIKEMGERRNDLKNVWPRFLELKILLTLACFIIYVPICMVMWHWENKFIPVLAILWIFCNSFADFSQCVCNGYGRMDWAALLMSIQRFIPLLVIGGALFFWPTMQSFFIAASAIGLLCLVIAQACLYYVTKATWDFRWRFQEWMGLLKLSFPNAISGIFGSWYLRIAPIMLGKLSAALYIGYYTAAYRVFESTYIIPAAIMGVSVPHFSEHLKQGVDSFNVECKRIAQVIIVGAIAWGLFLFTGSKLIINVLYGESYAPAIDVLRVLAFVSAMVFVNTFVTHLMVVINQQVRHAVHEVLVFIITCYVSLFLIYNWTILGAAYGLLIAEIILFVLTMSRLIPHFKGHYANRT